MKKRIGILLSEGRPIAQAVAISLDEGRRAFHAKCPKCPLPRHLMTPAERRAHRPKRYKVPHPRGKAGRYAKRANPHGWRVVAVALEGKKSKKHSLGCFEYQGDAEGAAQAFEREHPHSIVEISHGACS